ncbi:MULTISPECIES: hypothetical protein [unclassified Beijerinckia]|uniref:hypothetical protein n=1 Tax=unclassified Beijerinckia TaxID=2638183 RepID=UPI000899176F|nr:MULTISPECIES: hypothetical protein [unclassified Beijerinckia]MDH7798486.1 hypothetical protein [Beijerinckia sp. GAS462]SED22503.1 hypothetical protein SAMN05443249_4785 [Beijerinckia sp. 28-YEA-48]
MKPTVIVRSVKRSWPACLLLAGTIQFVSTAPAQAGLFDFLFGNQQPRQPVYAPPPAARPHGEPLAHDKARRDAKRTKPLSANADGPSPTIARDLQTVRRLADVAQKQGITAALMQDPTLRSGDIVVTATGIAVYEGASSRKNPFRPLAQSRLRNRTDLAKLQRAFTLRQLETAAAEGDPMSPLVIHSRGKSTEFQAKTDPAEESSVIEKLGPPKLDLTATTSAP